MPVMSGLMGGKDGDSKLADVSFYLKFQGMDPSLMMGMMGGMQGMPV